MKTNKWVPPSTPKLILSDKFKKAMPTFNMGHRFIFIFIY